MLKDSINFVYQEEYWYVSAFLNTTKTNGEKIAQELNRFVKKSVSNIKESDIYRKDLKAEVYEMIQNFSYKCTWVEYIDNFPFTDENTNLQYDSLGYFKFKVEYFKDNHKEKSKIKPILIQQIPFILLRDLKKEAKFFGEGVYFDTESPIYVFVASKGTEPSNIEWTQENILKYKKSLAYWTVIYSGQWDDYSPSLYEKRIEGNLSNRLSELHYINRNSGFVYMAEKNFQDFFDSYMKRFVLEPTPKMRAILFALREINESLDLIFLNTHSQSIINIQVLEEKIKNLRLLRGIIQTSMSLIYNELDYNRRQHYVKVLEHLIDKFDIEQVKMRINEKFDVIYDAMQELYLRKSEENQKRTEKGLSLLNLLFGAGILADLGQVIMIALSINEGNIIATLYHSIIAFIISAVLIATIGYYFFIQFKIKRENIIKAVDGVIIDEEKNIVLIRRRYPPYQGFYALPGGFIESGENEKMALLREIKEETNLNVNIIRRIGKYDNPERDPRGKIESTAFLCKITGNKDDFKTGKESKEIKFVNPNQIQKLKVAFDHRKIIKDSEIQK